MIEWSGPGDADDVATYLLYGVRYGVECLLCSIL